MPVSLIAKKNLRYAGEAYAAGTAFEARDEADATVLSLTNLAYYAPTQTKEMEPEPVAEPEPAPEPLAEPTPDDDAPEPEHVEPGSPVAAPPRRRYRRRDMRAE